MSDAGAGLAANGLLPGLAEIAETGRDRARGGFSRHLFNDADLDLRAWFIERATRLSLDVEVDRNSNIWAWWGAPGPDAVVTGSHLDSVPGGGAFDGPLGVVSALDAIERLMLTGLKPSRPVAILVFAEEEGSRFGVACLGSRLMTGGMTGDAARALHDRDGMTLADAATRVGFDASAIGADPESLGHIGLFIELHVEQGRGLIDLGAPVALASSILAHGRWRLSFAGQGNHAGATQMADRRDPMVAAARAIVAIQDAGRATRGGRATVGRLESIPGGTNVIASSVDLWLDARAESDAETRALVADIAARVAAVERESGVPVIWAEESFSRTVHFDPLLRSRFRAALGGLPEVATGAGHDAGILAAHVPSAMLFVRNPTGISHSPEEFAEFDDCLSGVVALEDLLRSVLE